MNTRVEILRRALVSHFITKLVGALLALGLLIVMTQNAEAGPIPKLPGKRGKTFLEKDGLLVMEVEHVYDSSHWKKENKMEGFTGTCYFTWRGRNYLNRPGKGKLRFRFIIKNPGTYHLRIRNRHDYKDSTEQNDCFTKMDRGDWVKTFSSQRGKWTWRTNHEFHKGGKPPAKYELKAGKYTLYISGRSTGFSIDRIVLFKDGVKGEDETLPESEFAER